MRCQAGEGEAPEGPMASLLGSPSRSTSPRIGGALVPLLGNNAGLQGSPPGSLTSPPGSSGLITPQRAQVGHAGQNTHCRQTLIAWALLLAFQCSCEGAVLRRKQCAGWVCNFSRVPH